MRTTRFCAAAAAICLATSWGCAVFGQAPYVIYDNGNLENSWENWSWATVNLQNTSPVMNGETYSASVTSTYYDALYLENSAVNTSPYQNLSFWLNAGPTGGQPINVYAIINGSSQSAYSLPLLAGNFGWTNFVVPLSDLGAANTTIDGIWLQVMSGNPEPTFYVDDITLQASVSQITGTNPVNSLNIDISTNRHAISPMIYGMAFATSNQMLDLNFVVNRSGGNNETRYNWLTNCHNLDNDWYFESYPDSSAVPGATADAFVANSVQGDAQAAITIPMIGWTTVLGPGRSIISSYSVAKYGPQTSVDSYRTDCGNGVGTNDGMTWNIVTNNPYDANAPVTTNFQKGYVQHLLGNWGYSTNGGVQNYIMDNEHSIWFGTHRDIHPVGPTMMEIRNDMVSYASMVKSLDPNAKVWGPEEWGWSGYIYSGYDQQWSGANNDYNQNDYPDRKANGGWNYLPWLLDQLHQYNETNGTRLLDYFTVHCYPQNGEYGNDVSTQMQLLRNSSTRQFWDTNYVEPNWISSVIDLIPRMQSWVSSYYPGTKCGVTEYNWGGEDSINGGTAQADILGIFGRQGLDLSTRWTVPDPAGEAYLACKMYRNYDGHNSTFGDMSCYAGGTNNPDTVAVFASQRSSDAALTIMVVSKYLTGYTPVVLKIGHFTNSGPAQVWQLNSSNVIAQLPSIAVNNNAISTVVPGQSVTLFVVPATHATRFTAGPISGGNAQFWLNGQEGETFTLQSSPDLRHWTSFSTNVFTNAPFSLVTPTANSTQFFRAVTTQ